MGMENHLAALMDARRQALQQGRPLSRQEVSGMMANASNLGFEHDIQNQYLALQKSTADTQYKMAKKAAKSDKKNALIGGLGNVLSAYLLLKNMGGNDGKYLDW